MKVAYDMPVPHNQYGNGKYAKPFWDFYESEHQTVKMEFDTKQEAMKAYKAFYEITNRNKIFDVRVAKMDKAVYLEKRGAQNGY